MTDQQILEGNWNAIKGMLRQKWGQLLDSDLPQIRGDLDHLVEHHSARTGEGREAIEQYLQEMSGSAASAIGTAAETVRDYAQHAAETVQHTAKQAADRCMPAITKRNASSAIGRESRCWCVSEWA